MRAHTSRQASSIRISAARTGSINSQPLARDEKCPEEGDRQTVPPTTAAPGQGPHQPIQAAGLARHYRDEARLAPGRPAGKGVRV